MFSRSSLPSLSSLSSSSNTTVILSTAATIAAAAAVTASCYCYYCSNTSTSDKTYAGNTDDNDNDAFVRVILVRHAESVNNELAGISKQEYKMNRMVSEQQR